MSSRKVRLTAATAIAAASVLLAGACAAGGGGGEGAQGKGQKKIEQPQLTIGTAAESQGPAPAVEGAQKGGTVHEIFREESSHFDPGQIYVNTYGNMARLFNRTLVTPKKISKNEYHLVGDLATDAGQSSEGGKTWKFTLKDGLKWEDGKPITSKDIRHSVERMFPDFINQGPKYIQQWLTDTSGDEYRKAYKGPYDGKHLDAIETPDDKTVIFKFPQPQPEANFALSMPGYGVVPEHADKQKKYDNPTNILSSGPYKITEHTRDKSMTMERNENWDPNTDPVRNAYPDKWEFDFTVTPPNIDERMIADQGKDKDTLTFYSRISQEKLQEVLEDDSLADRRLQMQSPYSDQYTINMKRITDHKVRQAINHAFPSKAELTNLGGPKGGEYHTTLMSPAVTGWKDFDVFGKKAKPEGDPEKAKALLKEAGKEGQKIVYAYNAGVPRSKKDAVAIEAALNKAGFKVVLKAIPDKTWYDQIGEVDNGFDLYWNGWGADWPTGSTMLPPIYASDAVVDGGVNYSHMQVPEIDKEFKEIMKIQDPAEAAKRWGELDEKIVREITPTVPGVNVIATILHGSNIGGAEIDPFFWIIQPDKIFLKKPSS